LVRRTAISYSHLKARIVLKRFTVMICIKVMKIKWSVTTTSCENA